MNTMKFMNFDAVEGMTFVLTAGDLRVFVYENGALVGWYEGDIFHSSAREEESSK